MTLLVTGGAGFIGSNFIVDWLEGADEPIVNLDALTYAGNRYNLAALHGDARHCFVHGNIADRALLDQLLAQHQPRAVLHFAAESHVDRSIRAPSAFVHTNVLGTFTLLEAVRGYWNGLTGSDRSRFRLLHVSTDEVFGSLTPQAPTFAEDDAYAPNSPYAATKAASDHLVRAWHQTYGLPVLTTHGSNSYGPYHFPEKLIPLMILNALAGKPLPIYGDGQQLRDWLYVRDHTQAIRLVLERGRVGQSYNIGSGQERSNLEVVHRICATLDGQRPRAEGAYQHLITHVADRLGHDRRYAVDARKIEREMGWRASEAFDTGLHKTVQWILQHPEWVANVQAEVSEDASVPRTARA